jgi:D-aminopeptidase
VIDGREWGRGVIRWEKSVMGKCLWRLVPALVLMLVPGVWCADVPEKTLRARDLGVPFEGTPGPLNAITDVAGVEVGHTTLISGEGPRVVGQGPVRTGVTAILPRGKDTPDPAFGAWFTLNGNGEMTGTTWLEESGVLEGPVMITNTLSVGIVHHAVIRWGVKRYLAHEEPGRWGWLAALPVVAETWDGSLNDIMGQHVTEKDTFAALDSARGGPVQEGNVGGGTGMICHQFKGGIGTASRSLEVEGQKYTLGALVQCNYGTRRQLRIAGVPVGREIPDLMPTPRRPDVDDGSIIVAIATDAPLLPHQLKRVARRASLGLGRNGSISGNGSGDIFIAFSTANGETAGNDSGIANAQTLPNGSLNPVFTATVQATEEAIINAMVAARTMTGADGVAVHALPHDRLQEVLRKYNRLENTDP